MGISENADSPLLCSREIKLMQYPKDDIQKEILKAAEKVFLENGFPKASMREIAQEAQVGLSNIYNYFKNKDDIFCTVVRPVISAFERMLHEHHGRYGADIMEMYSTEYLRYVIEEYMTLIQKHRKLLVLLFFHAQGSSLENFKENFTERSINPEKRNVPLYKNDAFQKVQKRRVQKSGEPGPSLHDQSPPLFSHLNTI